MDEHLQSWGCPLQVFYRGYVKVSLHRNRWYQKLEYSTCSSWTRTKVERIVCLYLKRGLTDFKNNPLILAHSRPNLYSIKLQELIKYEVLTLNHSSIWQICWYVGFSSGQWGKAWNVESAHIERLNEEWRMHVCACVCIYVCGSQRGEKRRKECKGRMA